MPNRKGHRRFGNVRKRQSGRYQARYQGPDGLMRSAPRTFATKAEAERWLTLLESEIIRGDWQPPEPGQAVLAEYAERWIRERKLEPRSRELYAGLLKNHLVPELGRLALDRISPEVVRRWRSHLLASGTSATTAAKAYRLLRAIMNTAVREDRIVRDNPCRMKGYDHEPTPERPTASVEQVFRLAECVPARFRALVLFAAFTGLRWGELIALRRADLDLADRTVRVSRKLAELQNGQRVPGPPKSAAGFRTVALPPFVADVMVGHLAAYVPDGPEALLFTGAKGASLRRNNFHRAVKWADAVAAAGLPAGFHFHDLRHTGNNLAAAAGASTRELMHRMGHASMRAALIYQHATSQRDREIAEALGARVARHRPGQPAPRGPGGGIDGPDGGLVGDSPAGALDRVRS
ncbi:MAG TPA: tyrosine-type recombinase/integrase [Mycobacteriales bacterium]|nr:tyrosine-type recombinase/integrase [Mycobacteriales bacterium]